MECEGSLDVLWENCGDPLATPRYAATFCPYSGPGGAVPARRFVGEAGLVAFLECDIGLSQESCVEIVNEVKQNRDAFVARVRLDTATLARLGLI